MAVVLRVTVDRFSWSFSAMETRELFFNTWLYMYMYVCMIIYRYMYTRVLAKAAKERGSPPFLEQILFDVVKKNVLKPQISFELKTTTPL